MFAPCEDSAAQKCLIFVKIVNAQKSKLLEKIWLRENVCSPLRPPPPPCLPLATIFLLPGLLLILGRPPPGAALSHCTQLQKEYRVKIRSFQSKTAFW